MVEKIANEKIKLKKRIYRVGGEIWEHPHMSERVSEYFDSVGSFFLPLLARG